MLNVTGLGIHHGRAAKSWELRNQVPSPIGYWLSDRPFLSINNDMEVRLSWSEDFHFLLSADCMVYSLYGVQTENFADCMFCICIVCKLYVLEVAGLQTMKVGITHDL